jgi:alpha-1,2-glucosyltransferase
VGCDLVWLRCLNLFCITTLQTLLTAIYYLRRKPGTSDAWDIQHSALNATLFPPLFFFTALYYTDVPSTLSVLAYHWLFLHFNRMKTSAWISTPILTLVGISSLLFRQTNIFWVAVFPAGILLVNQLDRGHQAVQDSMQRHVEGFGDSLISVAKTSWKMNTVFNPPAKDAWLEGNLITDAYTLRR